MRSNVAQLHVNTPVNMPVEHFPSAHFVANGQLKDFLKLFLPIISLEFGTVWD